jgi:hypothetical protein
MINLPASLLTHKLTKIESENVQAMFFYKKYQSYLKDANINKKDLIQVRASLKSGRLDLKNNTAALELEIIFKADAIENWNLAQMELQKYNNFELNRKYKN